MGSGRWGVRFTLVLLLLLVCCTSVSSSEHHDSGSRGRGERVRHSAVGDTPTNAIPAISTAPSRLRSALGAPTAASDDIDIKKLKQHVKAIEDAMYEDEKDEFMEDDEGGGGEGDDPGSLEFNELTEPELPEIDPTPDPESINELLKLDALAEAESKAFDEAFPELVRFQHSDETSAGDASSKFHEEELKGTGIEIGDVGDVGDVGDDIDDILEDYLVGDDFVGDGDDEVVSTTSKKVSKKHGKTSKNHGSSKHGTKTSSEASSEDSSESLIDLLTQRAPPSPVESLAESGFPQVVPGATSDVPEIDTELTGWQLTWSDEFDGDTLDASKWTARANSSAPGLERFGGQQQWYDPQECKVTGGALALRTRRRGTESNFFLVPGAERTSETEYPFVSCWVDTQHTFSQTYGRVEIRAQFPNHQCPGMWPQHWMLPLPETSVPRDACWPVGGEIDIASAYGRGRGGPGKRAGTVESGYHFAPKGECGVDGQAIGTYPSEPNYPAGTKMDFHSEFHTFVVEWDKESLKYFVDGELANELTRFHVPIIPRWPFFLILNTAVSPFGLPEALECDSDLYHYVDYVRVYKRVAVEVKESVYVFLVGAVGAMAFILLLAACCAMRRGAEDFDDGDLQFGSAQLVREKGYDSEDGIDRSGGRLGSSRNGLNRRRPLGPRTENLRLFDKPSRVERKRVRFDEEYLERDPYAGLRESSLPLGGGVGSSERAPLIGGVALRLPGDGDRGRV